LTAVGFFGAYVFDGGTWHSFDPDSDQVPDFAGRWLSVHIHDSDFAIVRYQPAGLGSGTAYLGCTPRTYFEDESASAPTDVLREAEGLTAWLALQQGTSDTAELRELVASFHADDAQEQLLADDPDLADDTGDPDDEDIFVEVKVSKFLNAVSLPVPAELPVA
jgi:hypothetical protein